VRTVRAGAYAAFVVWLGATMSGAGGVRESFHGVLRPTRLEAARPRSPGQDGRSATPPAARQASPAAAPAIRAAVDTYCVTCHSERLKTAGLALDTIDAEQLGDRAEVWERVARKLRTREMPPAGAARPSEATYVALTRSIEGALDAAAAARPDPGRVAVHRLNRAEYANAVRDLLDLEIDGRVLLQADEPDQQSFDNIASVLSVSPALLENYLSAAYKVSRLAIADATIAPVIETYKVPMSLVQDDRISDDLPFGSQGGTSVRHYFPRDGDYAIRIVLRRQLYLYIIGLGEPHQIDVRVDGTRVRRFTVGGEGRGGTTPESFAGNTQGDPEWEVYMHTADAGLEVRVPVSAGAHDVSVSFVRRFWQPEGVLQPPQRGFARTTNELYHGNPAVDSVSIAGPLEVAGARRDSGRESPSRTRVFVCRPRSAAAEEPCARQILSTLGRRAYRRPLTDGDVQTLLEFYRAGRADGDFERGIQRGLERLLSAPSFLFRIVRAPAASVTGAPFPLSDLDLASRLSFFLWSSIPDDELLDAAVRGRLHEPAVFDRQVRRMLGDARSQALVDNFATQWLKLGKLAGVVPDVDAFPEFDENLREAMRQETRLFIASQVREDRSVTDLVTADYTFVNERLARHYRIPDIYGSHFRRVRFADGSRGGLLGHAGILTVTSYPNRTSPVLRGKWLLDNMLGSPPPAPPPDVPALNEGGEARRRPLREQMEAHRRSPTCAACHVRMDPLGFSLESFDALGGWRTAIDGAPIDTTATLPDGTRFDGIAGLRAFLAGHREDFVRTFTEKLLSYALGRGLEHSDLPAVRAIVRESAANDYRWSALVAAVARSTPFRMSVAGANGRDGASPPTTARR
jgi:mono/diheme cytochrome c family protein